MPHIMESEKVSPTTQTSPARTVQVQSQVNEVIGIMHTNIDKVVQRGEKLESLEEKTQSLQQGALSFKKTSNDIKNEM